MAGSGAAVSGLVPASLPKRSGGCRNLRARADPIFPGLHAQAELIVIDPQIAVAATHDSIGHDGLDFLRHHADIGLVAAIVAEAVEAETVVEMAEQDDVMLGADIGHHRTHRTHW